MDDEKDNYGCSPLKPSALTRALPARPFHTWKLLHPSRSTLAHRPDLDATPVHILLSVMIHGRYMAVGLLVIASPV